MTLSLVALFNLVCRLNAGYICLYTRIYSGVCQTHKLTNMPKYDIMEPGTFTLIKGKNMEKNSMVCIDRSKAMRQPFGFMTPDYVETLAYNAPTAGPMGQNNPITKSTA